MQNKEIDQTPSSDGMQVPTSLPPSRSRGRHRLVSALAAVGAGLVASLLAVVLMGVLRLVAGVPTPMELFGDRILKLLPATTFVQFLTTFGSHAKTAPLGFALLGMIVVGTLLGLLYAPLARVMLPTTSYRPALREWLTAAGLTGVITLIGVLVFWGEIGQNFFGLPIGWAMLVTGLSLLADFSFYALMLGLAYRALLPKRSLPDVSDKAQSRRQLLARAGVVALGVGATAGTLGLIRGYQNNLSLYDGMTTQTKNGVTSPITPNSEHYVVTQNAIDPTPHPALWRLEMSGLVGQSGSYTYEEVKNLPSTSRAITLECIANGPGGHLMSTAVWQGVPLRALLERHGGAQANARYIAFYSVDGFTTSLPLEEVLAVDPLLAWRMNGAELPLRHGFPVRALIPGRFGEEQPKWLTRIELTDHFVGGLYSDQGWYNGPLHTTSRIDRPSAGRPLSPGQTIEVGGIAFAGNRGIQKVEVSTDNGVTWHTAQLEPPLSPDAWVLWTWQWMPFSPGRYTLAARATDGTGEVQTNRQQGTVPNGATGYHMVKVQVG